MNSTKRAYFGDIAILFMVISQNLLRDINNLQLGVSYMDIVHTLTKLTNVFQFSGSYWFQEKLANTAKEVDGLVTKDITKAIVIG